MGYEITAQIKRHPNRFSSINTDSRLPLQFKSQTPILTWKIQEYSRDNYNLKGCLKKRSPSCLIKGNLTTFFKTFFVKLSSMEIRTDDDNGNQYNNFLFIKLVFIRNLWENAVSKEICV